jgi:hypothetical protein
MLPSFGNPLLSEKKFKKGAKKCKIEEKRKSETASIRSSPRNGKRL